MGPLVTVIIPTYYRNGLLIDAIESSLQQEHENVEILVVDGTGESHAETVVEEYSEIEYIPLENDPGAQATRSAGAQCAEGDYIQFLDDDDRLHPQKFTKQLPLFTENVGVVYSGVRYPSKGEVVPPNPNIRGQVLEEMLRFDCAYPCPPSSMLIKREILDKIMPLKNQHAADDLGMKIELAMNTEFDYINEPLVDRRLDTEYSLGETWENIEGRFKILSLYSDLYDEFPDEVQKAALSHTYVQSGKRRLQTSTWSFCSIRDFARAVYHTPTDERSKQLRRTALLLASLFGAPGVQIGRRVQSRIFT